MELICVNTVEKLGLTGENDSYVTHADLTIGKIYICNGTYVSFRGKSYQITNDSGSTSYYKEEFFKTKEDLRDEKIDEILN